MSPNVVTNKVVGLKVFKPYLLIVVPNTLVGSWIYFFVDSCSTVQDWSVTHDSCWCTTESESLPSMKCRCGDSNCGDSCLVKCHSFGECVPGLVVLVTSIAVRYRLSICYLGYSSSVLSQKCYNILQKAYLKYNSVPSVSSNWSKTPPCTVGTTKTAA